MADTTVGVAKVVKLGGDTLLIVDVDPTQEFPEGEYSITRIKAVPKDGGGPGGASDWCVNICGANVQV
jgi:hypothetical protein